jgi:hypothetical protein
MHTAASAGLNRSLAAHYSDALGEIRSAKHQVLQMGNWKLTSANLIMAVVVAAPLEVFGQVPAGSSPRAEPHQKLLMIALDNY